MLKSFRGKKPKIAESAFISERAYIIGDVEIGENSNVWPGVVIRGDHGRIKIGNNVSVQDNSVIHADAPMVIGDNVLIGHCAVVHCQRIGSNVLIGNNATLLDSAQVGNRCIIGANAMVEEGMQIPDGSFVVGVPARVKKELPAERQKGLEHAGEYYAQLAREYKEEGGF